MRRVRREKGEARKKRRDGDAPRHCDSFFFLIHCNWKKKRKTCCAWHICKLHFRTERFGSKAEEC